MLSTMSVGTRAVIMLLAATALAAAGPCRTAPETVEPDSASVGVRAAPETVTVKDPQLEQRVARLELRVLEREAQVDDLEARLDEARREVVRSLAKLQT